MANIECDTKKIKSCGEDIVALADDFENIVQNLFTHINNIDKGEEGWKGEDADKYITSVIKDKEIYLTLYNSLKKLGLAYQETADKLEDTIRKVKLN